MFGFVFRHSHFSWISNAFCRWIPYTTRKGKKKKKIFHTPRKKRELQQTFFLSLFFFLETEIHKIYIFENGFDSIEHSPFFFFNLHHPPPILKTSKKFFFFFKTSKILRDFSSFYRVEVLREPLHSRRDFEISVSAKETSPKVSALVKRIAEFFFGVAKGRVALFQEF
jgi:hypothetical protein